MINYVIHIHVYIWIWICVLSDRYLHFHYDCTFFLIVNNGVYMYVHLIIIEDFNHLLVCNHSYCYELYK